MDENEKRLDLNDESGMTRRDMLRRGAIVGGTLLWVAPAIQSMAPKAFAVEGSVGSQGCAACYCWSGTQGNRITRNRGFEAGPVQRHGLDSSAIVRIGASTGCYSGGGGAFGGPFTSSEYCSGTSCDTNTQVSRVDHHGAFCT